MALVFASTSKDRPVHNVGDCWLITGTLTFSGSYATGGDALDLTNFIPLGKGYKPTIICLGEFRGNDPEYDSVNQKLKLFSAANTEVAAAAYNAALTASPINVAFLVIAN